MHRTIDMTLSLLFLLRHLHASSYPAIYPTSPSDSSVPCLPWCYRFVCVSESDAVGGRPQASVRHSQSQVQKYPPSRHALARVLSLYPSVFLLLALPTASADRGRPVESPRPSLPLCPGLARSYLLQCCSLLRTATNAPSLSLFSSACRAQEPRPAAAEAAKP